MTTATELLMYLRKNYSTFGRAQRQKLLYYIQAWSLSWTGHPAFGDEIVAWEKGPVVEDAWRADNATKLVLKRDLNSFEDALSPNLKLIVASVFEFYGRRSGTDLISLTHSEQPWDHAFNTIGKGLHMNVPIASSDMKRFYTEKVNRGEETPKMPELESTSTSWPELADAMTVELARWAGVNRILADR